MKWIKKCKLYWNVKARLGHKILRSRITITRKRKTRKDHKKKEDAFEGCHNLVKADIGELAEKEIYHLDQVQIALCTEKT